MWLNDNSNLKTIKDVTNVTFKGVKYLRLFNNNEFIFNPNSHNHSFDYKVDLNETNYKEYLCKRIISKHDFQITLINQTLTSLVLASSYKSLEVNFEWSNMNSNVSFLIGENGSGKTTLFTLLDECLQSDTFEFKYYTHKYFTSTERVLNEREANFESFNNLIFH